MTTWPLVALGDVFEIARGGSPRPIDDYLTEEPDGVNWIMISDASEGSKYITRTRKRIRTEGVKRSRRVNPGDFLLTNSMSFGRPYIVRIPGCIHDGWLVLSKKRDIVDQDFFFHLLESRAIYSEFVRLAAGATVKNLNIDAVRGVQVPLPPLPEQRRIAEVLDRAQALRATRRAALAQLDALTQSIFLDMFGDPATNPKAWSVTPLAALCSIAGEYGAGVASKGYDPSMPRYVRITDVTDGGDLSSHCVSPAGASREWEGYVLSPGDVLFARSGATVGKTYIHRQSDGPCVFAGYLIRFRPKADQLLPPFLFQFTRTSAYRKWVSACQRVVAQPNINAQQYGQELLVPVPPMFLQRDFARRVAAVEKLKATHRASLAELDALFASLQHRAFRGEL